MIKINFLKTICKRPFTTQFFVPKHDATKSEDIDKVREFLRDKPRILVLTGAGISTESGSDFGRNILT